MTRLSKEPAIIHSMPELLATAKAMEVGAIAGYQALAEHMRRSGKPKLVEVFEQLVAEERGHLASVEDWTTQIGIADPVMPTEPDEIFDDEGMNLSDPNLLSAYRAFSVAVRNEERAFLFWTYVSAHAPTKEIAHAAERMAREELGHVSTLRRERRLAFHLQRKAHTTEVVSIGNLERELVAHLENLVGKPNENELAALAIQGLERAQSMENETMTIDRGEPERSAGTLAEILLDYYLDQAERSMDEKARNGAQHCAGQLVATLAILRGNRTS